MKTFFIANTLFLLFFTLNLNSQSTTFEYLLSTPSDEFVWDIVEAPDNNILYTGSYSTLEHPKIKHGLVVKLDKYGNHLDSIHIHYPDKSITINHIFLNNNNENVIVANIFDSAVYWSNAGIYLSKMNDMLHLSGQKTYNFPPSYYNFYLSAYMEPNGNILSGGGVNIEGIGSKPFIYEFNHSFDSLKAKFNMDVIGGISHLKTLPDGNYWTLNMLLNRYEFLDSSLNIIATQKVPNNITSNFGLAWDTDTSFYLLGDGLNFDLNSHYLSFIRQYHPMDTSNFIYNYWSRDVDTVDFPAAWNGIDFKNKDSIFIGGTNNLDFSSPWYGNQPSWFVILQTDSLLNLRWERFYGGDAYYVMSKLIASNDGGCILAGQRYDYLNTTDEELDIIVLKLNNEGLIIGNSENRAIKMHEAIVYPNPGNEVINVRIAAQYKQSVFELFDMNGKLILKQNFTGTQGIVNTTFLKQGTYIYRITSNDGLFESGKWVKQ